VNWKTKDAPMKEENERCVKKAKLEQERHTYPSLALSDMEDDTANERNVALIKQEMSKPKPSTVSITSLMSRTFPRRRQWILDEIKPVGEIMEEYPCLRRALFVCFCLS